MFASHLILGVSLIGFAWWLHQTEKKGWPNEARDSELDEQYLSRRRRTRRKVNFIFALCGVLVLIAGVSGPRLFVGAWMSVTVALLTVVVLAAIDVVRTQRYHGKKVPELRRRMLDGDE